MHDKISPLLSSGMSCSAVSGWWFSSCRVNKGGGSSTASIPETIGRGTCEVVWLLLDGVWEERCLIQIIRVYVLEMWVWVVEARLGSRWV